MDKNFYFSAKGRVCRKDYWIKYILMIMGVSIVFSLLVGALMAAGGATGGGAPSMIMLAIAGILYVVFSIAVTWVQVCVSAKRFHDRNMSGWWVLWSMLIILAMYAIMGFGAFLMESSGGSNPIGGILMAVGGFAVFAVAIALFVILGFLPGTKGPNQYGPDPLDPTGTEAAAEVFS